MIMYVILQKTQVFIFLKKKPFSLSVLHHKKKRTKLNGS